MFKRNTIQRSLVLKAVKELQCHATADEVYEEVVKNNPHISKGTVYRNLNQLSEMGEIHKLEVPGGADRFDHLCHEHYHVKCIKCGRVFDVDMEYLTGLENNIKDSRGVKLLGHDILFRGICPKCDKK